VGNKQVRRTLKTPKKNWKKKKGKRKSLVGEGGPKGGEPTQRLKRGANGGTQERCNRKRKKVPVGWPQRALWQEGDKKKKKKPKIKSQGRLKGEKKRRLKKEGGTYMKAKKGF